jgi:hypothetical protein
MGCAAKPTVPNGTCTYFRGSEKNPNQYTVTAAPTFLLNAQYTRRNPTFLRFSACFHAARQQPCERGWEMQQYSAIVALMGAGRCRALFVRPAVWYRAFRRAVPSVKLPAITPLSVLLSPPP